MVERLLNVGEDVLIHPTAEIRRPNLVTIGNHVAIDEYVVITTRAHIHDYIHIAPLVTVVGGKEALIVMMDFSTIAAGARIICGSSDYLGSGFVSPTTPMEFRSKEIIKPVIMEKFSHVATNSVVLPGVTLKEGSVLAALSFAKDNLEPWTIYAGIPAKPIKERPKALIMKYAEELKRKYGIR